KLYINNSSGTPLIAGDFSSNEVTINGSLDITGTFSNGTYTFATNGNVNGLGTINSGSITSTGDITSNSSFIIGNANI